MANRPLGIKILCGFFGSSTICAAGEALFIAAGLWELPLYYAFVLGGYATSTFHTSVGLWQMQRRALYWLRAWMLMCIPLWVVAIPVLQLSLTAVVLIMVVQFAVSLLLNSYVGSAIQVGNTRQGGLHPLPSS
jgi:hypothetical protein